MDENKKPENPSAFPLLYDGEKANSFCHDGMTLRDYFAAKAMQGLLSNSGHVQTFSGNNPNPVASYVAELSLQIADAMLKHREN